MLKDVCFQLLLLRVVLHKFPSMCIVLWWLSRREIAAKLFSRKKNKAGGITPVFRPYHKVAVIKTVWHWHKNRCID